MEVLKKRRYARPNTEPDHEIAKLSWSRAFKVGLAECIALIPRFSRTGATMGGGLLVGLDHKNAARFSFLLAAPIILAAAVLKLPELLKAREQGMISVVLIGAVSAAISAYVSMKFLTKYFESHGLRPFAWYCIIVGMICSIIFLIK